MQSDMGTESALIVWNTTRWGAKSLWGYLKEQREKSAHKSTTKSADDDPSINNLGQAKDNFTINTRNSDQASVKPTSTQPNIRQAQLTPINVNDPILTDWQKTLGSKQINLSFFQEQKSGRYAAVFKAPDFTTLKAGLEQGLKSLTANLTKTPLATTIAQAVQLVKQTSTQAVKPTLNQEWSRAR
jgi:hypothetical protein